jgi:hypothetical protein
VLTSNDFFPPRHRLGKVDQNAYFNSYFVQIYQTYCHCDTAFDSVDFFVRAGP